MNNNAIFNPNSCSLIKLNNSLLIKFNSASNECIEKAELDLEKGWPGLHAAFLQFAEIPRDSPHIKSLIRACFLHQRFIFYIEIIHELVGNIMYRYVQSCIMREICMFYAG